MIIKTLCIIPLASFLLLFPINSMNNLDFSYMLRNEITVQLGIKNSVQVIEQNFKECKEGLTEIIDERILDIK